MLIGAAKHVFKQRSGNYLSSLNLNISTFNASLDYLYALSHSASLVLFSNYRTVYLPGQIPGVVEALSEEHDLSNHGRVGHHHGDWSEHGLEVVGQLCASGVTCRQKTNVKHNILVDNDSKRCRWS